MHEGHKKFRHYIDKHLLIPTVIIVRVPSIRIPIFFAQRRPERDRHRI